MVEPDRADLSIVRQCRLLSVSRSTFYAQPSGESDENLAIMDWWRRKVLSWRLFNTIEVAFCIDALEGAVDRHGRPEIFNSDQGSQFTSSDFIQKLKDAGIRVSMDGKGRWLDNMFVKRLWRSLK